MSIYEGIIYNVEILLFCMKFVNCNDPCNDINVNDTILHIPTTKFPGGFI